MGGVEGGVSGGGSQSFSVPRNRNISSDTTNKEFHHSQALQRQASIAMFRQGKKITLIMPWFKVKIVIAFKNPQVADNNSRATGFWLHCNNAGLTASPQLLPSD